MNKLIKFMFYAILLIIFNLKAEDLNDKGLNNILLETSYMRGSYEAQAVLTLKNEGVNIDLDLLIIAIDDLLNDTNMINNELATTILKNYDLVDKRFPSDNINEKLSSFIKELKSKNIDSIEEGNHESLILSYAMGIAYTSEIISKYEPIWDLEGDDHCLWGTREINYNIDSLIQGFKETLQGKGRYSTREVNKYKNLYFTKLNEIRLENDKYFYNDFATQDGVEKTKSGILYFIDNKTNNLIKNSEDIITVHVSGRLINGCEVINTYKNGNPETFVIKDLVVGWQEIVPLLNNNEKVITVLPAELSYGNYSFITNDGKTFVDANSMMIFEIERYE